MPAKRQQVFAKDSKPTAQPHRLPYWYRRSTPQNSGRKEPATGEGQEKNILDVIAGASQRLFEERNKILQSRARSAANADGYAQVTNLN